MRSIWRYGEETTVFCLVRLDYSLSKMLQLLFHKSLNALTGKRNTHAVFYGKQQPIRNGTSNRSQEL